MNRNCGSVACVDCSQVFHGNEYNQHNVCVSEAEKYEKSFFKKKPQKKSPQEIWMDILAESISNVDLLSLSHPTKNVLKNMQNYPNVPRNENKFKNFLSNCMKVYNQNVIAELWTYLSSKKPQNSENSNDTENVEMKENENKELKTNEDTDEQTPVDTEKNSKKKRKNADDETNSDENKVPSKSKKKRKCELINEEKNEESKNDDNQVKIKWKKYVKQVFNENQGPMKLKKFKKAIVKQILSENVHLEKSTVKILFDENVTTFKHISIEHDMVSYK